MIDHEIKDTVRRSWDHSSGRYDSCPGHGIGTEEEKVAWKRELTRNLTESPLRVLDVGCGTGAMALLFAEMGHQVMGGALPGGKCPEELQVAPDSCVHPPAGATLRNTNLFDREDLRENRSQQSCPAPAHRSHPHA
jgi:SAM-dependent methyltransferase